MGGQFLLFIFMGFLWKSLYFGYFSFRNGIRLEMKHENKSIHNLKQFKELR